MLLLKIKINTHVINYLNSVKIKGERRKRWKKKVEIKIFTR